MGARRLDRALRGRRVLRRRHVGRSRPRRSATGAITEVVDPYIIEVAALDASGEAVGLAIAPVSYRERLRALGPSNKPDHGKQAAGGADIERLAHARGAARSSGRVNLIRRK